MLGFGSRRLDFSFASPLARLADSRPISGDRRTGTRHITILRVALLHSGSSKELCVVRNISAGGLSARVYRQFEVGETVHVEFRSDDRLEGVVKWVREFEIGIGFAQEIEVQTVLTSRWITEDGRRQRLPRIDLRCPCQFRVGCQSYLATLVDISQGGAKLQLRRPLQGSAEAILTLPDLGRLEGSVRWSGGVNVGIAFNERLPFETLARWIQARRNAAASAELRNAKGWA